MTTSLTPDGESEASDRYPVVLSAWRLAGELGKHALQRVTVV